MLQPVLKKGMLICTKKALGKTLHNQRGAHVFLCLLCFLVVLRLLIGAASSSLPLFLCLLCLLLCLGKLTAPDRQLQLFGGYELVFEGLPGDGDSGEL